MITINLQAFKDYDMPVTQKVMLAPNNMSQYDVNKISVNIGLACLNDADTDRAFILLKEYGFVEIHHIDCIVGGDL